MMPELLGIPNKLVSLKTRWTRFSQKGVSVLNDSYLSLSTPETAQSDWACMTMEYQMHVVSIRHISHSLCK